MNIRFLPVLPSGYEIEVNILRVNMASEGMTIWRIHEVIGDRYTNMKRSDRGGHGSRVLFAGGGKQGGT